MKETPQDFFSYHSEAEEAHKKTFSRSLWNRLCLLFQEKWGDDPQLLKKEEGERFVLLSKTGKLLFDLQLCNPWAKALADSWLLKKGKEMQTAAAHFSSELRSLSFWDGIARWMRKMEEQGEDYRLSFEYSKKGIPNWIQIDFEAVRFGFYLSQTSLPFIIESLRSVKSPLKVVHEGKNEIISITYDKEHQILCIHSASGQEQLAEQKEEVKKSIPLLLEGWRFIPDVGFYTSEASELLKHPHLHGADIPYVLSEHGSFIAPLLEGCRLYREAVSLSYHLSFDFEWNFQITAYLFEVGDLTKGASWLMEGWAYCEDDGFYPIEGGYFHDAQIVIPCHQVSDFITQHHLWLNEHEGFKTSLNSIEYQLDYQVTSSGRLIFFQKLAPFREEKKTKNFGAWTWIEGEGFYSKQFNSLSFLLKPGLSVGPQQIPLFIKMNRDELVLIPGFFAQTNPVSTAKLKISLKGKNAVSIAPQYDFLAQWPGKQLLFFDEFVYIEQEGFYELPVNLEIKEKFRHQTLVEGGDVDVFLSYEMDELLPHTAHVDPQLIRPNQWNLIAKSITEASEKGRGWYRLVLEYHTDRGVIPIVELKAALRKKKRFSFFPSALIDTQDSRFDWLRQLPKEQVEAQKIVLSALQFMQLVAFQPISLLEEGQSGEEKELSRSSFQTLMHFQTAEKLDLEGFCSLLRPYQEIGVRWLWFLYRQRLSGLLCDDMGLGKTHQAMGLLAAVQNFYRTYAQERLCPFLIVCPTSVIYHWEEKLRDFLPHFKVCAYFGGGRRDLLDGQPYDVLLTSYGIIRNEEIFFSEKEFEVAIFDEIQIAKNPASKIHASLIKIRANMKIGLTGTPIENHVRELKALFDLILPFYMPGDALYRELFVRPIEKGNDREKKELLNRLIHPFTLRRKKEEVLKELPEKTEQVAFCALLPDQKKLYCDILEKRRSILIEELQDGKAPIPYIHIFSLLSSLKQICDHPAVYFKDPLSYKKFESGKWELFIELLNEARQSGQKVVVFSQYLHMLDIIENYLEENKIGYASLRGSTTNRNRQLFQFNRDPNCEVFTGSLHAAGLGIDLTAASVAIHYDRWWNAAREDQATDRIHRIGQTRGVQVFKLVTKGSFEEKIDAMIRRKKQFMEDIIGADEQHVLKIFSRSDLIELLDFIKQT